MVETAGAQLATTGAIQTVKTMTSAEENTAFTVTDLTAEDLQNIDWSGGKSHIEAVQKELQKVASGEAEYLAVRDKAGLPVSIGAIDYTKHAPGGTIWQLVTKEDQRGKGAASLLILEAENRMRRRGVKTATLGVETSNPVAKRLYSKLGYTHSSYTTESWALTGENGEEAIYSADVELLDKTL